MIRADGYRVIESLCLFVTVSLSFPAFDGYCSSRNGLCFPSHASSLLLPLYSLHRNHDYYNIRESTALLPDRVNSRPDCKRDLQPERVSGQWRETDRLLRLLLSVICVW